MKRLSSFFLAFVLVCTCVWADPIDVEQAKQIAAGWMSNGNQPKLVKRAVRNEAKARKLAPAVRQTSPYYIFSRGEGQGFVIVSGDDCLPEVLGYTESGDYEDELMSPNFKSWLGYYQQRIEEAQEAGQNVSRKSPQRAALAPLRRAKGWKEIPVMMTSHWHQSWPYNNRCPIEKGTTNRSVTGCVATAAAQVLYFFRKDLPNTLLKATPRYNGGKADVTDVVAKGTPMKWDLMLDSYSSNSPQEYCDAVSDFVYALGAGNHLDYSYSDGTSGQITDLVGTMNDYFNVTSECVYKSDGSTAHIATATWEDMLYKDLAKGRPVIYTGYSDTSGGHAVVVDGFQSSTGLFHFNFGWGGQGDGYYTVDDETGMNHFNTWQGMTYKVTPKRQNLEAKMSFPEGFHMNHDNVVKVQIQNKGTMDYSGVYLFVSASKTAPSNLNSAKSKDTQTVLPNDGSTVTLELTASPTAVRDWYLTLTDKNLNIIEQKVITPDVMQNDLTLNYIDVLGSATKETHNGAAYTVINDSRSTLVANIQNHSSAPYQDSPRMEVYVSEDDGATFTLLGERQSAKTRIEANSAGNFEFSLINTSSIPLETGKLYYAALRHPLTQRSDTYVHYATNDTIARFLFTGIASTLDANLDGKSLTFTGDWSAYQFDDIAKRSANKGASLYDLTDVTNIGRVPQVSANPNALYYVAANSQASGINVVKLGEKATAEEMVLQSGQDYSPLGAIQAGKATFRLNLLPNRWYLVTMPFAADVPDGIVVKRIDEHAASGISSKTTLMSRVEAGQTYLVMTASKEDKVLRAENVEVVAAPVVNADPAVVGTFVATEAPAGSFWINDEETQMFTRSDEAFAVEAFQGYFQSEDVARDFRANSEMTIDPGYQKLGVAISEAIDLAGEYRPLIQPSAYQTMLDSILAAKHVFTTRPMLRSRDVTAYHTAWQAALDSCTTLLANKLSDVEIEMTSLIANPSFETGGTSSSPGSLKGWTTGGSGITARDATSVNYKGVGADGKYLAYSYVTATKKGMSLSQTISGLPAGLYSLTAKVGTAPEQTVTLFAGEQETTVEAHDFGQYYLTEARIDSIVVKAGDELTIGVKEGAWYKADDFRLFFTRSLTAEEDPTAIEDLTIAPKQTILLVEPVEGGIRVITPQTAAVSVYAPTGAQVARRMVRGTATINLPRGLYIVGGKKIMVR